MQLWIPKDIRGEVGEKLVAEARALPPGPLTVHVDCNNGDASCWDLAQAIMDHEGKTTAIVGAEAKSAGLIVACACEQRACYRQSQFLFHGFAGQEEANHRKSAWFASRTRMGEAGWYRMAETGELHEFDCDNALSWGVVNEVIH